MKNVLLLIFLMTSLAYGSEIQISQLRGIVNIDGKSENIGDSVVVGQKIKAIGKKSFFQLKYKNGSKILVRDGSLIIHQVSKDKNSVKLLSGMSFYSIQKKKKEKRTLQGLHKVCKFWCSRYKVFS